MLSRRAAVLATACLPLASMLGRPVLARTEDDPWPDIRAALFDDRPIGDAAGIIALEAPQRAYDAAIVPIAVVAEIPQESDYFIRVVHLVIDKNPAPVAGVFHFTRDSGNATFATRVRVNEYTNIRAIAEMSDDALVMATQFVKAAGGCSAPALKDAEKAMANLGRMKLKQHGAAVLGRPNQAQLLISHPNFSGLQFDQVSRHYVPAHFVQEIRIRYGDRTVMFVEGNISLSEDPSIHFHYVPDTPAAITAEVKDSDGLTFSQSWPVDPIPAS